MASGDIAIGYTGLGKDIVEEAEDKLGWGFCRGWGGRKGPYGLYWNSYGWFAMTIPSSGTWGYRLPNGQTKGSGISLPGSGAIGGRGGGVGMDGWTFVLRNGGIGCT